MKVCLASRQISGDLTTWALIGALSGVSRREQVAKQPDGDAETRSITRLEGSRWRGGRLWSYKPGSTAGGMRRVRRTGCVRRRQLRDVGRVDLDGRGNNQRSRGVETDESRDVDQHIDE